eukprot:scaffold62610_cov53-Phaeocystis_antarctica.AAC.1
MVVGGFGCVRARVRCRVRAWIVWGVERAKASSRLELCSIAAMLVGFAGPPRRSVSLSILSSRTPSTSTPAQEQERHDLPCRTW